MLECKQTKIAYTLLLRDITNYYFSNKLIKKFYEINSNNSDCICKLFDKTSIESFTENVKNVLESKTHGPSQLMENGSLCNLQTARSR